MSDQQDHMDFEVNTHVEVSVTPFPCKGRLPKKNPEKVWSFAKPGGGSPMVNKKPNLKFADVFSSVSMQNHSRTPKTYFTLGVECLCHIFSP